jgi:hypothetical protein
MPRATADTSQTHHKDLKSCPEGFVEARRLTYGEKLQRRAMTAGLRVEAGKKGEEKDFAGEMKLITEESTLFDFQKCILDHNLTDENEQKLNLTAVQDIRRLDPRVGEEIDQFLSELNNFEEDEGN